MYFDKMCSIVEREQKLAKYEKILRNARLFHFPAYPKDFLPGSMSAEEVTFFGENFFLPFPIVAIEDANACVVLWDENSAEDVRGFGTEKSFMLTMPLPRLEFTTQACLEFLPSPIGDLINSDIWVTVAGKARGKFDGLAPRAQGTLDISAAFKRKTSIFCLEHKEIMGEPAFVQESYMAGVKTILSLVTKAYAEVMYLSTLDRLVVEETPLNSRHNKSVKKHCPKIPRSHERSLYTYLYSQEIRKKMGMPCVGGGRTVVSHERRAHTRTYRSSRYTKMRGQRTVIKSMWIGPVQKDVGKKRYRVCVDLNKRLSHSAAQNPAPDRADKLTAA